MRKTRSGFFLMLCLLLTVEKGHCDPVVPSRLMGTWVHAFTQGRPGDWECPDFITFSADGAYTVVNECSGTDPFKPVVEEGKWALEQSSQRTDLLIRERKVIVDDIVPMHGRSSRVRLLYVDSNELRLEACGVPDASSPCMEETYKRWLR